MTEREELIEIIKTHPEIAPVLADVLLQIVESMKTDAARKEARA